MVAAALSPTERSSEIHQLNSRTYSDGEGPGILAHIMELLTDVTTGI